MFVISYCALHFIPAVRASYEIQCLIPYIPTVCASHETQCLIPYIPTACASYEIQYFLYRIFRLPACCMKLSVRHIILRFTFHSGCPRVVRNSVFLIPYIPFARVLHETPCFSYYIFRLYARCMKLSVRHIILRFTFRSGYPCVVRNSVFLIPYIPFARVLHETQCSSYHTALYISFRLSARRTKFSVLYHIFRLYARCMKLS